MLPTLVLAAGSGRRLDPITRLVAKPAVPLAGRSLIERSLLYLQHHGIRRVVVNLHHRPESITAIVGDGHHLGLDVRYSWEPELLGSAGGPRHALPLLEGTTILIVNGDTLTTVSLAPLLGAHLRAGAEVTLAVIPNPAPHHYNGIVLDEEHVVLGFLPKGQADRTWHFVGMQIAEASVFASLADGVPAETIAGLYRERLRRRPGCLHAWPADTVFHDVGTPEDYRRTALALAGPGVPSVVEPGADVSAGADVTGSVIWATARVEAGAHLEDCVVAGDVVVPSGLSARRATLVPAGIAHPDDAAEVIGDVAVFPFGAA